MVGKLLAKIGVASSTITGIVYFDVVPNNSARVKSKEDNEQATKELETIEDIELFERIHGCDFVFVNSWEKKEFYSARAFYELKKQDKQWKQSMMDVLKKLDNNSKNAKNYCKDQQGAITLFDDQHAKTFRMGIPQGGWDT